MKKLLLALVLIPSLEILAQPIRTNTENTLIVKQSDLIKGKSVGEIVPNYPSGWIDSYVSTEITVSKEGKKITLKGTDDKFTSEQKAALQSADMGSDLTLQIKYKAKNAVNGAIETNNMKLNMTVLPDVIAEFPGGKTEMTKFLNDNFISKIAEKERKNLSPVTVVFTVNENGEISGTRLSQPSTDAGLNKLLLDAVNAMPRFKPAEMASGEKVKQEFRFTVGERSGC